MQQDCVTCVRTRCWSDILSSSDVSSTDRERRLTRKEIWDLMRGGEIPITLNDCVMNLQPLANVNGKVRCVRGPTAPFCDECPFYATRTEEIELGVPPKVQPLVENEGRIDTVTVKMMEVNFEGRIREVSKARQYVITVPMAIVKKWQLHKFIGRNVQVTLTLLVEEKTEN